MTSTSNPIRWHGNKSCWRRPRLRTLSILIVFLIGSPDLALCKEKPEYPVVCISSPVVSPSGDSVAFVAARADPKMYQGLFSEKTTPTERARTFHEYSATFSSWLWVLSLKDGKVHDTQTEVVPCSGSIAWSPSGSHVAFVSGLIKRDAKKSSSLNDQIYCFSLRNGKVTARYGTSGCRSPKYSADGQFLAFVQDNDLVAVNLSNNQTKTLQDSVWRWQLCWNPKSPQLYYIRKGSVCEYNLSNNKQRVLFSANTEKDQYASFPICSPDGRQVGFHLNDKWFHTINLASLEVERRFKCDHYFVDFDWNFSGICYLDTADGEYKSRARLLVFDPNTGQSSLVATGPFAMPRWLNKSEILVRRGNVELWTYPVTGGQGKRVFSGEKTPR